MICQKAMRPKKVLAALNAHRDEILCVRGNCDTEVDQMVLSFPILADYAVLDLGEKPSIRHAWTPLQRSEFAAAQDGDIFLHGHTHIPKCTEHETYVCMNPGSVSIPKKNSPHSYMTLENGVFLWKTLAGEIYREYRLLSPRTKDK